jgi:hypothetical protein
MKTPLLIAAAALILSAPAMAETPAQPTVSEPTTFEGWIRVSGEEFQLITNENRFRTGMSRPCVSGALPRNIQRTVREYAGQKVRITGVTMAWSDDLPGDRYTWEGSNIRNECESEVVILATEIDAIA